MNDMLVIAYIYKGMLGLHHSNTPLHHHSTHPQRALMGTPREPSSGPLQWSAPKIFWPAGPAAGRPLVDIYSYAYSLYS